MARKYITLDQWIASAMTDSDKEAVCTNLVCVYNKPAGGTKEVHTVSLKGKTHDPTALGKLFQGKAEAFAQDLGGIQSFEMQAFYGKTEPQATHTFTVVDGEVQREGRNRALRESPSGEGLTAQAMRHAEKAYELLNTLVQQSAVMSVQRETSLAQRIDQLQNEVNDAYQLVREMLLAKVKDQHELFMKQAEYERTTIERRRLLDQLPALVNTASGREVFPQSTADSALIDALAERVSPDMIAGLASSGLIPPELAGPLQNRLAQALEKKKAEREAIVKMRPSNTDPRLDAAGEGPSDDKAAQ
jgi:hypothetical protein